MAASYFSIAAIFSKKCRKKAFFLERVNFRLQKKFESFLNKNPSSSISGTIH